MGEAMRWSTVLSVAGALGALAVGLGSTPASADTPEEKFIRDLQHANAVVTSIPSTPERWVRAGYASCGRIQSMIAQGLPARAAINNEVIAATTFNVISRQNAVALVTYAVLDLCPSVVPARDNVPPIPSP